MTVPKRTSCKRRIIAATALLTACFAARQFSVLFFVTENFGNKIKDNAAAVNEPQLRGVSNAVDNEKNVEKVADEAPPSQPLDVKEVPTANQVTCDSNPCNGLFSYSPPNTDTTNALEVMTKAIASYNYGNERNSATENKMIFMPTKTDPHSCMEEWKSSRPNWVDR
jgi:hypothetical protein